MALSPVQIREGALHAHKPDAWTMPVPGNVTDKTLTIFLEFGGSVLPQKFKNENQAGFASIVEVAVTTVVFVLATAGILSTMSMLKPHGKISEKKIEAAYVGKGILDEIRKEVGVTAGGDLFGPNLALGAHGPTVIGDYTVNYTVAEDPPGNPDLLKVTMTITWPDS